MKIMSIKIIIDNEAKNASNSKNKLERVCWQVIFN